MLIHIYIVLKNKHSKCVLGNRIGAHWPYMMVIWMVQLFYRHSLLRLIQPTKLVRLDTICLDNSNLTLPFSHVSGRSPDISVLESHMCRLGRITTVKVVSWTDVGPYTVKRGGNLSYRDFINSYNIAPLRQLITVPNKHIDGTWEPSEARQRCRWYRSHDWTWYNTNDLVLVMYMFKNRNTSKHWYIL